MQKYGIVVILFAFPIFPRTSLIPSIISGYLSDEIKALNVFVDELLDFTSTGKRFCDERTKKSSSSVEFSFL